MTALLMQCMLVSLPLHILTFRERGRPAVGAAPSFALLAALWLGGPGACTEFFWLLHVPG